MFATEHLEAVLVATDDLEAAVAAFRRNFGLPVVAEGDGGEQKVRRVALGIGGSAIEMVAPAAGEASPISAFLAERGPGLYMLVLAVDDLGRAASDLAARGIETSRRRVGGRDVVLVTPTRTHGARIALVAANAPAIAV